jgi:hypothetical protein
MDNMLGLAAIQYKWWCLVFESANAIGTPAICCHLHQAFRLYKIRLALHVTELVFCGKEKLSCETTNIILDSTEVWISPFAVTIMYAYTDINLHPVAFQWLPLQASADRWFWSWEVMLAPEVCGMDPVSSTWCEFIILHVTYEFYWYYQTSNYPTSHFNTSCWIFWSHVKKIKYMDFCVSKKLKHLLMSITRVLRCFPLS